jgi:hypothetical protein
MMNREQILAAKPELARVKIVIKEKGWKGTYYVREFNGLERDSWEQAIIQDRVNARLITVVRSLFDEQGRRVFQDEDVEALRLSDWPGRIFVRISNQAMKLNKLGADDVETEKGNSDADPDALSTST